MAGERRRRLADHRQGRRHFILRLECKIHGNGSTGVGFRIKKTTNLLMKEWKSQSSTSPLRRTHLQPQCRGSPAAQSGQTRRPAKHEGDHLQGSLLIVKTNGVEALHLHLDQLTVLHVQHRQSMPVSQRAHKGFIGLQGDCDCGEPVEFRNIPIKVRESTLCRK